MLVGIQLYSVRDDMAKDFEGTLKAVRDMGYDGVEFAGLFGKTPEEVKSLCAKYNLVPISAHVSIAEMKNDPKTFENYKEIGCKYIAIPYRPLEDEGPNGTYEDAINEIRELSEKAKAAGLQMIYHNHDFEFRKLNDGRYFIDKLYDSIPADLLETELDTCWVKVAGEDPVEYLKKYAGRNHIVHLKDFYKKGENVDGMYELIGIKPTEAASADEEFGFRPLGRGLQNMPAVVKAAEDAGADWVIVEQDRPTPGKEPINEIKISIDYLRSIGY